MSDFLGPSIIVVVLLVLPVVFLVAGGLGAVILGSALHRTVENDHEGSEFIDLNR